MEKANIINGLKSPFTHFGLVIKSSLLLIVATLLGLLAAGSEFLSLAGLPDVASLGIQVVVYIIAALIYLLVFGMLTKHMQSLQGSETGKGKLLSGFLVSLVVFIYLIPYGLSLYVYGNLGIALSLIYVLFLVAFLPAIITRVALTDNLGAGFAWGDILGMVKSSGYWIALVVGFISVIVYSLLSYALNLLLLVFSATPTMAYVLFVVSYLLYLIFLLLAVVTLLSLFASTSGSVSAPASRTKSKVAKSTA